MKKGVKTSSKGAHNHAAPDSPKTSGDQFTEVLGFSLSDLTSINNLLHLLCRPTDPAGLGVMRFIFGMLMLVDIWQERGLSQLVEEYGDPSMCRFPLFHFLKPLPLVWMYIVYLVMFIGEVGILLGLCFRVSCLLFVSTYWYLLLLDKTSWNNHSYLFGLIGVLLLITDTNRYWSLDGLISRHKRHAHIPLWNYAIFRFQIFIVYFLAGLKKLDADWVSGHSMNYIAGHWVFAPFRLLLTEEQVSLYIVHFGGLIIDLSMGFLMFFDKTRNLAFAFGASFHIMNSQLFSIGMFPWMMLATMPLFCSPGWPRPLLSRFPAWLSPVLPAHMDLQTSNHCLYQKHDIKADEKMTSNASVSVRSSRTLPPVKPGSLHKMVSVFLACYAVTQCLLPYSHGITKGYNHWAQGLYGYSWDMMVHTWKLQHIKVTYVDRSTGEEGYLNPKVWVQGSRWSSHPDMIKQYGECVHERLDSYNITDVELYLDVWRALNNRFQQRALDPRVNIIEAPWSPLSPTPWLFPLLVDLSDWRGKLVEIEREIFEQDSDTDVVFVADFPGLYLENYVQAELGNTSITVLKGEVTVELVDQSRNITLTEGKRMQLPPDEFHNVHTVSEEPSCYMYIFVNTTDVQLKQMVTNYEQIINGTFMGTDTEVRRIKREIESSERREAYQQYMMERSRSEEEQKKSYGQQWRQFLTYKLQMLQRSVKFTVGAVQSLVTGQPFEIFLNTSLSEELAQQQYSEQPGAH
ncbi:vitamin K-dependent gamma-carboxylase-like isoform X2 [Mya arenaria]|nr:vitamin K-dependent gamma-carboxylase-like isoform X2 [Mya arenaria]XP_052764492.1 vitamin K-dependent gamma-carboxylase-like isoform X2 [Mya arenaria]XP_052764498.1 vitamin K-dependent gamma-carboxylase-like isoform X2 [Mya arenaria]